MSKVGRGDCDAHSPNGDYRVQMPSYSVFGCYTTDVICSTAFGVQVNSHMDQEDLTVKYATLIFNNKPGGSLWSRIRMSIAGMSMSKYPSVLICAGKHFSSHHFVDGKWLMENFF